MANRDSIINFIKEQKDFLYRNYNLTSLGIFGSYSRNEQNTGSDLDLIVEFVPDTKNLLEKKEEIKKFFSKKFKIKVDICREKYLKPYYKQTILESVIYV